MSYDGVSVCSFRSCGVAQDVAVVSAVQPSNGAKMPLQSPDAPFAPPDEEESFLYVSLC